tara:strand:- start:41376 stop:41633 length:258 start_codon:yes stop_codon:yes gene_type:complete
MLNLNRLILSVFIILSTSFVWAQDKKRAVINFEDELIQGEASKPELFYLLQRKQYNFKKLIRLRENFLPEMKRTSEELHRSGSGI